VGTLGSVLERAEKGAGGVIALLGDEGAGKTRLLDELQDLARARGALVLAGRAWAIHTRLAYAPLVDALGPHLRELAPPDRERLVDDLPELDNLFVERPRRPLDALGDPHLEKTRLFEAFCRLVERLAESRTVVLTLDDAHWADLASIEMLHYLCRNVRRARILVALTVRVDEPESNSAVDELLHSLGHAGLLTRIEVGRLSDEDVLAMARLLLEGELSPSLESMLAHRTRGVPLLVEELVRSLLASGQLRRDLRWKAEPTAAEHLPGAVRELVGYRLARLTVIDRSLLEMLAVDGEGLRAVELSAAGNLAPGVAEEHLARLARERLVVAETSGGEPRFILAHPLVQQVLLDALGGAARPQLHLALVRALEKLAEKDLGRLARHYIGAGAQAANPRALEVVIAAAEHAAKVHAPAEAASLYAAAVELARGLGRDDSLPHLLAELGTAQSADGDPACAIASWSEAAKLFQARGERKRSLALRAQTALAMSTRGQNAEALELLRVSAIDADPEIGVRLAEAHVMIRDRLGDVETLDIAVDELRSLAEQWGEPSVAITAKRIEAWLCASRVECPRAWELLTEALDAARALGDPLVIFNVLRERFFLAMSLGDIAAVESNATEAAELARTRLRSAPLVSVAEGGRLAADWARGEWQRAAARVPQLFELTLRAGDKRFAIGCLYGQAQAAARSGDAEQARMCLDEAKRQAAEGVVETRIEGQRLVAEGELKLLEGDIAGAIAALEEACGPLPGRLMRSEFPIHCLHRLANAYLCAQRFDAARKIARSLDGAGPLAEAQAARIRGRIKGAEGTPAMERALEIFRRLDIASEVCECSLDIADLLPAARREEAVELAQDALAIGERLGAWLMIKRARARLLALGDAPAAGAKQRRRSAQSQAASDGAPSLTARESEVAVLIARGLTNEEVAQSLHISRHTVGTYIKRMYQRLGLASRVELTRYVLEHHLGGDD
jgi:DNA-binding CsgD family transcriptional regulator